LEKSEPFLEPTHYAATIDGKKRYWTIRLTILQGISLYDTDKWIIEQKWGRFRKPEAQSMRLEFDNELKARQEFDNLIYLKKQEGYKPIFK
jgi:predicted DNA-binding WGR domain protein